MLLTMAQEQIPDWTILKLNGKVKHLITASYKAISQGDTIIKGDKIKSRQTYTYNASENITFNESGYITNATGADEYSRANEYITFKYNKHDFMDETVHYGSTKMLKKIQTYKYDDYGGVVAMRHYGRDKLMIGKTVYKLDRVGNILEQKQSDNNKKTLGSRKFSYDENNNCISTMILNHKSQLILTLVSEFDDKNSLIKTTTLDINRKPSTSSAYSYKYDSLGNWTERIEIKDNQPYMITVRDFIFYE